MKSWLGVGSLWIINGFKSAPMIFSLPALHLSNNASVFICICPLVAQGCRHTAHKCFGTHMNVSGSAFQRVWQLRRELAQYCNFPQQCLVPGLRLAWLSCATHYREGRSNGNSSSHPQHWHTDKHGHSNRTHITFYRKQMVSLNNL